MPYIWGEEEEIAKLSSSSSPVELSTALILIIFTHPTTPGLKLYFIAYDFGLNKLGGSWVVLEIYFWKQHPSKIQIWLPFKLSSTLRQTNLSSIKISEIHHLFTTFKLCYVLIYFRSVKYLRKNHNTDAVSGPPNPPHSPSAPGGGQRNTQGGGYKNVQWWGQRNTQGGHINAQVWLTDRLTGS